MKKCIAVFVVFFIIIIFEAAISAEYILSDNRAVDVVETDTNIDIYMRMVMIGEKADDFLPNERITYEMAFVQGICEKWSGEYEGKKVEVHIIQTEEATKAKKIRVYFDTAETSFERCCADKQALSVWMYINDLSTGIHLKYSYEGFKQVAAHEIGHIMGLADVYNDENEFIRQNAASIMRSWSYASATDFDYYVLLNHKTWLGNGYFQYSDVGNADAEKWCKT